MVSASQLPQGVIKTDPYLGTQEIYTQQVEAAVPFMRFDGGAHPIQIKVTYQGCAEAGLCYPPITKVVFPARRFAGGRGERAALPLGRHGHSRGCIGISARRIGASQGTQARHSGMNDRGAARCRCRVDRAGSGSGPASMYSTSPPCARCRRCRAGRQASAPDPLEDSALRSSLPHPIIPERLPAFSLRTSPAVPPRSDRGAGNPW